jgi:hypothetical protein
MFKRLLPILFLMLFVSFQLEAQVKPLSKEKQKKELRKKKEKQMDKQRKAEENLKKRHLGIQDKATKKRMKAAKKKSDKLNRNKRRKR